MKPRSYFLLAIILLVILGVFLTLGIINSRRIMMELIREEGRSLLSIVASTQENLIFAEGEYEDEIIEKLVNICNYLEMTEITERMLERVMQSFGISSIVVTRDQRVLVRAGYPFGVSDTVVKGADRIFYEYFTIGQTKYLRFSYRIEHKVYHIEISAEEIKRFRQEFGINKLINQLSLDPMVKYLVFQDQKGIIFATPNIQTISRIDDDTLLVTAMEQKSEASRIAEFETENILELIRPFIVESQTLGLFRIGISLDSYNRHIRETERQLLLLFVILFGAGFVLFFFFMKYQSYVGLTDVFDKTLGAVEDAVLAVNNKGIMTGINKAFANLSSFEEKMLLGKEYSSFFKDDPFDVQRVLERGSKIVDEKVIFNKNIQYSTYPLIDGKNRISGVISVLRDVTKMREFEREKEEAERLTFLGNLVANFAHEIKNPLNGLSIATQRLIREFPSDNTEYMRLTTTVRKEIESLNKILNDFLSLARPRIKEKEAFNLSELMQNTLGLIRAQVRDRHVILKENISKDIKLIGNSENFKRAILNVLLNAIDALSQVSDRQRELVVKLTQRDSKISIVVADNGIGMDIEERERIFTPYFTTKKQGTGLGLYIAQKIIRDHKGLIEIKTAKNQGTKFVITLEQ